MSSSKAGRSRYRRAIISGFAVVVALCAVQWDPHDVVESIRTMVVYAVGGIVGVALVVSVIYIFDRRAETHGFRRSTRL
ncbi:hypothetical protein [Isoptericola sp. NPDC057191]|uniref:hypothetical protein n=1 Tax=Isoptericola sp. NPDC057191 TaxID=3346041 RepID=UPI0036257A76